MNLSRVSSSPDSLEAINQFVIIDVRCGVRRLICIINRVLYEYLMRTVISFEMMLSSTNPKINDMNCVDCCPCLFVCLI